MKINKLIALFSLLLPLTACGPKKENTITLTGALQTVFSKMVHNNFTLDITSSLSIHNKAKINTKSYYTSYSIQSEGDNGFNAVAQKEDYIFRYSIFNDEIITGTPILDNLSGLRYDSIYDYKPGADKFDITALPTQQDADGYFTYNWGENENNDKIFLVLFLQMSSFSLPPEQTKIKVIGDTLEMKTIVLDYTGDLNYEECDTIDTYVYNINNTENTAILEYLDNGGDAKDPIDNVFYRTINPYLTNENYRVNLDATQVKDASGAPSNFYCTRSIIDDAVLYETQSSKSGFLMTYGVASSYRINESGELEITGTPVADSDGNFYYNFLGEIEPYYFGQLDFSLFIGYKSEENTNTYILSDTYLLQILSGLCLIQIYDEMYADYVIFEVVDEEKHEFNLHFDLYNKVTNQDLGRFTASFYDYGVTTIPQVEEYRFKGQPANAQDKQDLIDVLEVFKNGNYSLDFVTSVGLAKYYYTDKYMFAVPYSNKNQNYGFIKYEDGLYYFNYDFTTNQIVIDYDVNYKNTMDLPGVGSYYFAEDDLGYISHLSDEIYNYDQYVVDYKNGNYYWKNDSISFSTKCFDYFKTYTNILPTGTGFMVHKGDSASDSKLTIVSNFISNDGRYAGLYEYTFYDIGITSFVPLDAFLA